MMRAIGIVAISVVLSCVASAVVTVLVLERTRQSGGCILRYDIENSVYKEIESVMSDFEEYDVMFGEWKKSLGWFSESLLPQIAKYQKSSVVLLRLTSVVPVPGLSLAIGQVENVLDMSRPVLDAVQTIDKFEKELQNIKALKENYKMNRDAKTLDRLVEELTVTVYPQLDSLESRIAPACRFFEQSASIIVSTAKAMEMVKNGSKSLGGRLAGMLKTDNDMEEAKNALDELTAEQATVENVPEKAAMFNARMKALQESIRRDKMRIVGIQVMAAILD